MIVRIWRTALEPDRVDQYEHFARTVSLEMFRAAPGNLGTTMARSADTAIVITLWATADHISAFETSEHYRSTVERILSAGFLRSPQSSECFVVHEDYRTT